MQDPRLAGFNYGVGWGGSPRLLTSENSDAIQCKALA